MLQLSSHVGRFTAVELRFFMFAPCLELKNKQVFSGELLGAGSESLPPSVHPGNTVHAAPFSLMVLSVMQLPPGSCSHCPVVYGL